MKIRKILFVTKFEDLCYDALRSLLSLQKSALEHVVFLNVIERDRVAMRRGSGYSKKEAVKLKEMANIRFIDWAENLFEMGMEVGAYIEVSSLVPEILRVIKRERPDLIVVGRSHKGKLEQLYSHSDITELIRRVDIPILVFKHILEETRAPEKIFERPLLATSWSEGSHGAFEFLKELGPVLGQVHLMHVVNPKDLRSANTHSVQLIRKKERKRLDALCDQLEALGVDARAHVYVGDPEAEIRRAAKEYQASLVLLGSSARSAMAERWMGSISRNIADKSIYPCLLFPMRK